MCKYVANLSGRGRSPGPTRTRRFLTPCQLILWAGSRDVRGPVHFRTKFKFFKIGYCLVTFTR